MKTSTPKNLFYTVLISIFFIGMSVNGYAQCGAEAITTTQWCENGFAKWSFNSPTPNTWYEWYSYTPAPYVAADFDANGHLIRTGSIFYDSTQSSSYYSPFRITTATAPPAGVQLTYIKRTSYPTVNPKPGATPAYTSNPAGTAMQMTFTNTMPVRFNTIKIPVVLNTVGQTYKIQITFTPGAGSAVYNFSTVGATPITGITNGYYIEVPVNYTLTTTTSTVISVNTNPTGTGAQVDGLLFSPAQPATTTNGPITIPANSASTTGGKFGVLYDWNYTAICPPQTTPLSTKTTVGCCVAPGSINILTLSSNKATIVNGSGTAVLTVGNYSSTSNYFDWYFNGVNVPAASGVGKITYTTNQVGNWEVHELTGGSPSAADKTNPSCYSSDATRIDDKLITASIVTAPSHSPLCIGDTWSLSGTGSSNLTWSTGGGTLSNTSGSTTDFTASQVGTTQVILSGTVTSGDLVVNGNFSAGTTGFVTSMPGPVDPRSTDGSYNVAASSGNWGAQGDWTFNGTKPFVTGNPGNFLVVNGEDASSIAKPVVWGQNITGLTANQIYTFSFDFTSICYVVSANTGGYSNAPGTAPFYDVDLEVYINGVLVGSASTDFALNGGVNAVGVWKNHAYTWNSATSSFANIEIRQKNLFPMRGYDFGLDNIKFGGLQTQTDAVTIGPITDCSAITATASACVNDSYTDLTASATGGLIFDHWELTSTHATVSTANPYRVQTLTATQYDAVGYMGIGNVLSNGDFNSGNIGFISGAPYYTYAASNHGDNQYSVDANINTYNPGYWVNLPQAPGQPAGSMRFFADAKAARTGQPSGQVIAWTFTAAQNAKFAFSGYFANVHGGVLTDTLYNAIPAAIGVYINNVLIASYWSINDLNWHQLTAGWTAPLAGTNTYTLEVRDLKRTDSPGSDFALDDFKLVPLSGTAKKFTVTTPVCNPCLINLPTLGSPNTFCANTGIVHLTPNASEPNGIFEWYDALTAGNKLGTSQGIDPDGDTLNVSTAASSGANKIVYYQKSAKASGTVYTKAQSCNATDWRDQFNINNNLNSQGYYANKAITLTSLSLKSRVYIQTTGCGLSGTITFRVVGAKPNGGGLVDDQANVLGTLTANYNITKTAADPQDQYMDFVLKGNVSIPAGTNFFITPISATATDVGSSCNNGRFYIAINDCDQTFPIVDSYDGATVSRVGASQNGNNPTLKKGGPGFDLKFNVPAYVCPRTAVTLTPSCPCSKPTTVAITAPASTPISLCQGTAQTLSGTVTVAAAPLNTAFTYSWFKTAGSGASTTVPLTTGALSPNPTVGTATAVPNNTTAITGPTTGAGTYVLRVEDGNTSNASCYTEASVVVVVNPTLVPSVAIAVAPTGAICAGASVTFTATPTNGGTTPTYQWNKGGVAIAGATNATYTTTTAANSDSYTVTLTSNALCASPTTATSSAIVMTVNPVLIPAVSIAVAPTGAICAGTSVTFTATPTNGGTTPGYQWKKNGTNIASATNATYTTTTAANSDVYTVVLTSNALCASPLTATSTGITMTVNPVLVPAVSIAVAPTGAICAGASLTFTATPTNGGTTPTYQWKKGGVAIAGATNATFTTTTAANSDSYTVTLTSNALCASPLTATSTAIVTTVNPVLVPAVSIAVAPTGAICAGASVTFTATPTNGGTTPGYQWKKNGTNIASATNATYTTTTAANADVYTVTLTSNALCASPLTATSTGITMTVNPILPVSVTIATPSTTICAGTSVTFTATPTNGGTTPTYQWKKNGTNIASATNATYTTTTALNNDSYTVVLTSNATCPSGNPATSNAVVITVTTVVTPAVTITAVPAGAICAGASVTFTAVGGNGGTAPTYQWKKNTVAIAGETNLTYTSTTLANGDQISVDMVSNSGCASTPNASSNVITMVVNPIPTPSVTAAVSPTGAICAGASLTFTATPTNGGTTPAYQWKKGGAVISGATNATYTTTTAANNDSYTVEMISNATCAPTTAVASTAIVVTVNPILVPSVTVAASPTTICTNGSTTFTATPTNPGATPGYQWFINTVSQAGATNATFSTTALTSSTDVVKVTLTSNALCASPTTASGSASVTVNAGIGAGTIGIATATICYNTIPGALTQTVAPTNIAGTPTYTWEASPTGLPGTFLTIPGATNIGYTPTVAITQDAYIRRVITDPGTPAPCNVATSNTVHIIVNPQLVAGVIAGIETTCANVSTTTITSTSLPTGGTGSYTYQWQSGTAAGGPYANIPSATNTTYSPGILATTTYFVRVETSGTCGNVTSNEIMKTVNPILVPSVTVAASPTTICTNGSTTFTATPTNPGATPGYQWFINTVSQAGATNATFSTTALTSSTDVVKVTLTSNALCASPTTASGSASVTVNAGIGAGTIGIATATICYNTIPGALTQTVAPTNIAGTPTYTWEASPTGLPGTFLTIPGATNIGYTPTVAITQDAYIRRVITDPGTPAPCNVATSNTIHIIVRPQFVVGVIGSNETGICAGSATATMSETTAPTGGTGTYTYQWQSAPDVAGAPGSFTNIGSGTNATYNAGNLSVTMYYQLIETSGTCGSLTTNIVSKTVSAPEVVTAVIDNAPGQVCVTATTIVFTANGSSTTGTGTLHYAWTLNNIAVGTDSPTYPYTISTADNGKVVKVVVSTSTLCNAGTSFATYTLDIVSSITPTVSITTPNNPNCAGLLSTFTATATNAGTGATYQWYVVPAGSAAGAAGNPVGTGATTYSSSTLAKGDRVRVELTSTSGCLSGPNPFKSTEIVMDIKPIPAPVIQETDQTVCSPASVTFHGTVGTGTHLQWKRDGVDIAGATNANYTATEAGNYTLYEDNLTCNSTSAAVNLTIVQTPIAHAGADIFIKEGETSNLNGSGGSTYSWSPATYLSDAAVSNPNFTATQTITYILTVSNTSGATTCSTTDDVTVYVVKPIEVPNVITVNGDGNNDDWEIKNIEGYPNVTVEIYNRWGNLVWKSSGYVKNWDGTNYRNGEVLADGTYFYIIDLKSEVYPEPLTGWIQIIK